MATYRWQISFTAINKGVKYFFLHILESLAQIFQVGRFHSVIIFSILVPLWHSVIPLMFFHITKARLSGFFQLRVILYMSQINIFHWYFSLFRRSVSQGAAQKTAREKIKKARRAPRFFIFSPAVFCAAP